MSSGLFLKLPFPPTLNHYRTPVTIQGRARLITSKQGRVYRQNVLAAVCFNDMTRPALEGRLSVTIELCPPCKRKRDIDNYIKAVLDACTAANIWHDDEQVDELIVRRVKPEKPGHAMLTIVELDD